MKLSHTRIFIEDLKIANMSKSVKGTLVATMKQESVGNREKILL